MQALPLRIEEVLCWERLVQLRLPFRFGVITLTQAPQLFIAARVTDQRGRSVMGYAAEMMIPKWFDKRPQLTAEQNIDQLRTSVQRAANAGLGQPLPRSAWDLHLAVESECVLAAGLEEPGLVTHFGPAILQRAVLDGLAQLCDVDWSKLLQLNLMGINTPGLPADLQGMDVGAWLAARQPRASIHARHTVGLADVLSSPDQAESADGLPLTLEQATTQWQHHFFKLKLQGDVPADIERLLEISSVLDKAAPGWQCTLDGNEQFQSADTCQELLVAISNRPDLRSIKRALMYVEQPLHRDVALEGPLPNMPWPIMIDESDDSLARFPQAIACGYRAVSSKSCKGLYKALINRMRCDVLSSDGTALFISGEDLTMQPGIALQQDLALASFIGLEHVERNGHFYGDGMSIAPREERMAFCREYPDLYTMNGDRVELNIKHGQLHFDSLAGVGFAGHVRPMLQADDASFSITRN